MIKVEASSNGHDWFIYAKKEDIRSAREAASKCILVTNHTMIRLVKQ